MAPRRATAERAANLSRAAVFGCGVVATCAIALVFACSSTKPHPPSVDTSCPDGQVCDRPPITGGETGSDVAVDAGSDGDVASIEGGVAVSGSVRVLETFTAEPSSSTTFAKPVAVRARGLGGSTDVRVDSLDGTFTMSALQPGAFAWFEIGTVGSGGTTTTRTRSPRVLLSTPIDSMVFPEFDAALAKVAAVQVGIADPTDNTATIVLHVVDATGARLASASSSAIAGGGRGPFYDDGKDGLTNATHTGAQGTIVFLAVPTATTLDPTVSVTVAALTNTFQMQLAANAVTYLRVQVTATEVKLQP